MTTISRWTAAGVAFALWATFAAEAAGPLRGDVGRNSNATYEKECGGCHFPYQPGWLPDRSWRKLMDTLSQHFGDNAQLKAADREAGIAYLLAGSAQRRPRLRSREIIAPSPPGQKPISTHK